MSAIGLGLIVCAVVFFDERTPAPSLMALIPIGGTVLINLFGGPGTWVGKLLSTTVLVDIGLISYGAYLLHQPMLAFARIRLPGETGAAIMLGLSVAAFLLAILSWRFVERPFRNKRAPLFAGRRQLLCVAGAGCLALVAIGMVGQADNGLAFRMGPEFNARVAALKAGGQGRGLSIGTGTCDSSGHEESGGIQAFLASWSCEGGATHPVQAALYGDSHAADKAAAKRFAVHDFLQMTGPGCPLLPDPKGPRYCDLLLTRFLEETNARGIETVILANEFSGFELKDLVVARILDFWKSKFDNVVLFTAMPEFARFYYLYSANGAAYAGTLEPDYDRAARFDAILDRLGPDERVTVLDSGAMLCRGRDPCAPIKDGALLVIDGVHLAPEGIALFGETC